MITQQILKFLFLAHPLHATEKQLIEVPPGEVRIQHSMRGFAGGEESFTFSRFAM